MKSTLLLLPAVILTLASGASASPGCSTIEGGRIVAADGTFLGIASKYSSDGLGNPHSQYGSSYGSNSILNKYGKYGDSYNSLSPWNKYATNPPKILGGGSVICQLSKNKYAGTTVCDPDDVLACYR